MLDYSADYAKQLPSQLPSSFSPDLISPTILSISGYGQDPLAWGGGRRGPSALLGAPAMRSGSPPGMGAGQGQMMILPPPYVQEDPARSVLFLGGELRRF